MSTHPEPQPSSPEEGVCMDNCDFHCAVERLGGIQAVAAFLDVDRRFLRRRIDGRDQLRTEDETLVRALQRAVDAWRARSPDYQRVQAEREAEAKAAAMAALRARCERLVADAVTTGRDVGLEVVVSEEPPRLTSWPSIFLSVQYAIGEDL